MSQLDISLRELPSVWNCLLPTSKRKLLQSLPLAEAVVDSLHWLRTATKTRDDKDSTNPYKRFPNWPCYDVLHSYLMREPVVFVEKSRTMLITWWGAGECLHHVITHQPASCIFWCPDQDRA